MTGPIDSEPTFRQLAGRAGVKGDMRADVFPVTTATDQEVDIAAARTARTLGVRVRVLNVHDNGVRIFEPGRKRVREQLGPVLSPNGRKVVEPPVIVFAYGENSNTARAIGDKLESIHETLIGTRVEQDPPVDN